MFDIKGHLSCVFPVAVLYFSCAKRKIDFWTLYKSSWSQISVVCPVIVIQF